MGAFFIITLRVMWDLVSLYVSFKTFSVNTKKPLE